MLFYSTPNHAMEEIAIMTMNTMMRILETQWWQTPDNVALWSGSTGEEHTLQGGELAGRSWCGI